MPSIHSATARRRLGRQPTDGLWLMVGLGMLSAPFLSIVTAGEPSSSAGTHSASPLTLRHQHGIARPRQFATLRTPAAGRIAQIQVREGQHVTQGTPLLSMDDRIVRARLQIAKIQAARESDLKRAVTQRKLAEQQLERLEIAFERQAISELELEAQKARVEEARAVYLGQQEVQQLAQASYALALAQLEELTVVAPFDGVITHVHAKTGASVDPTMPLVSIANLAILEIEVHAPLAKYGQLRPGSRVHLQAGPPVNAFVDAQVQFVSPLVNSASHTFRATLHIENGTSHLPAGFSVAFPERESIPLADAK